MSVYDYEANAIDGTPVSLSAYRGRALLVVNTASRCAYSRQFAGLQRLYEAYRAEGFEVLAFPCDQFNGREPGTDEEVRRYCEANFRLTFPMFGKIEVRGEGAHPLYRELVREAPFRGFDPDDENERWMRDFLREKFPDIAEGDGIKWNFTKFLVDREGRVAGRYEPTTEPLGLEAAIRSLLERGE